MDEQPLKGYSPFPFGFHKQDIPSVSVKWDFVIRDTEKCPLSILTGVRIKRVNFRENV